MQTASYLNFANLSRRKIKTGYSKYGRILTKIFSLDDKTDEGSFQETYVSSRLPKIHAFLGRLQTRNFGAKNVGYNIGTSD